MASCSDDATARIWRVLPIPEPSDGGSPPSRTTHHGAVFTLEGHPESVTGITWCPDRPEGSNDILATCGYYLHLVFGSSSVYRSSIDGTVRLWDASNGNCFRELADHKRATYTLQYCPGGKLFATASGDGWLHVYNLEVRHPFYHSLSLLG